MTCLAYEELLDDEVRIISASLCGVDQGFVLIIDLAKAIGSGYPFAPALFERPRNAEFLGAIAIEAAPWGSAGFYLGVGEFGHLRTQLYDTFNSGNYSLRCSDHRRSPSWPLDKSEPCLERRSLVSSPLRTRHMFGEFVLRCKYG